MGLLQEIFISKQTLWNFEHGNLDNFPASDIKLNIIQNSIYGVDLEKGAVDIARLRFWLSLIVDEDEPKSLPNLDYKIVVGNSLVSLFQDEVIEIDWEIEFKNTELVTKIILDQQNKIYQLEHALHLFFQSYTNKESLKKQIKNLKIEILKNQLTLTKISNIEKNPIQGGFLPTDKEIENNNRNKSFTDKITSLIIALDKIKNNDNLKLNYFDWKLNFPEILNSKLSSNNTKFKSNSKSKSNSNSNSNLNLTKKKDKCNIYMDTHYLNLISKNAGITIEDAIESNDLYLRNYIKQNYIHIMHHYCKALKVLKENNILHCDIKTMNVMINYNKVRDKAGLTLIDFGLSNNKMFI
jgi:hypothetical protein